MSPTTTTTATTTTKKQQSPPNNSQKNKTNFKKTRVFSLGAMNKFLG
jgi:hypothetical protein